MRGGRQRRRARGAAGSRLYGRRHTPGGRPFGFRAVALDAFGRIDVWVNNAGRGITKAVLDLRDSELDEMMAVNVKSALYGMQAAVPSFIKRGGVGHVINVSSFLGRVPVASFRSAYSAAKAALNSLTTNLRMDLRAEYPTFRPLVMPGSSRPTLRERSATRGRRWRRPGVETGRGAASSGRIGSRSEVYTNRYRASGFVLQFYADTAAFRGSLRAAEAARGRRLARRLLLRRRLSTGRVDSSRLGAPLATAVARASRRGRGSSSTRNRTGGRHLE